MSPPARFTRPWHALRGGFVRAAGAFHPSNVPWMARRSYALELTSTLFFAVPLACVEGGVIAVVARKAYADLATPGALNIAVALLGAASELANIISFFWTQWSHGRDKAAFINALQLGVLACVALIALAPDSPAGLWVLVAFAMLARTCWSGMITLRPAIWRANYPPLYRARVVGRFSTAQVLVVAAMGIAIGRAMDWNPDARRAILPIAAAVGLVAFVAYRKLRVRRSRAALRAELAQPRVMAPWDGPLAVLRVLRRDRFFALFMLWMFVLGTGNLMVPPILVVVVSDEFGLGYLQGILITSVLSALCTAVAIPLWARFLDRSHIVRFRSIHSWAFVVATSVVVLAVLSHQPALLYFGSALLGLAYGGGALAWNLGHVDFAPPNESSQYMATHVTLNGLRGLIAPFAAVGLYQALTTWKPEWRASGAAAAIPLAISLLFCTIGAMGFVSLRRQMGDLARQMRARSA